MPARSSLARLALIALLSLGVVACSPKPADHAQTAASTTPQDVTLTADQLQHIKLVTIAPAKFHKTVEANGVVDFDNDHATSLLAAFSGPVTRVLVTPGQKVKQGDLLALVDSPDFSAAVAAYSKALATARTDRQVAEADNDLAQHKGVTQREQQQAQTDAANADADRDAALKALVALNIDPDAIKAIEQGRPTGRLEAQIRSPIAGTVVEKLISPGLLLQAGATPAFTIADLSHVWVLAQVSPSDLTAIGVGDPATVETGVGSAALSGTVTNIAALVDPNTRAVAARVSVDNPGGMLKKQMYVRVTLRSRKEDTGLMAPVAAVLHDDENLPFVYVAEAGGGFARRHVTLGDRLGDQEQITDGLQPGDRVVADGGIFVQFMQSQ